jgi:hypothetical protein
MKVLFYFSRLSNKFLKGIFALFVLNLLVISVGFVFESCQKDTIKPNAAIKFKKTLDASKKLAGLVPIQKVNNIASRTESQEIEGNDIIPIYLNFPGEITSHILETFQNANSIQDVVSLLQNANATVQYEPNASNQNFQILVSLDEVRNTLHPLVIASKEYLYSKGFTEQDIQEMLTENNATEEDLIPFVVTLTQIETQEQNTSDSGFMKMLPFHSTYAIDWAQVGHCAMHALGVNIIFSIGSSSATWTMSSIKAAFKDVAKRILGPIGVLIAVADFSFCMGGIEL